MSTKAVGTFRKFMLTPVLVHMFRRQASERRGAWSAQDAGAFGATLSGAGSAIVAIAPRERSAAVGTAMVAAWRAIGIEAELITCTSTVAGATVTHVSQTVQPVSTEIS